MWPIIPHSQHEFQVCFSFLWLMADRGLSWFTVKGTHIGRLEYFGGIVGIIFLSSFDETFVQAFIINWKVVPSFPSEYESEGQTSCNNNVSLMNVGLPLFPFLSAFRWEQSVYSRRDNEVKDWKWDHSNDKQFLVGLTPGFLVVIATAAIVQVCSHSYTNCVVVILIK